VCFVMYECVYVWVSVCMGFIMCAGVCMCGFCNVWVCGWFVMCECVYVWVSVGMGFVMCADVYLWIL